MFKKKKDGKLTKKDIIAYIISAICMILCIFITIEVISANVSKRPPRIFGYSVSYVPTKSMEPVIMAGDYVLYKKATFDSVEEKDIIVYRNFDDIYIIHEVISKNTEDGYIIAKGVNNALADTEKVTADMVYGKYIMTVDFLSFLSGGVNQNAIFIILIGIFVIMLIMQTVSVVIKKKTDDINKKSDEDKKLLLEQLKNQILAEELEKLKKQNEELSKTKDIE